MFWLVVWLVVWIGTFRWYRSRDSNHTSTFNPNQWGCLHYSQKVQGDNRVISRVALLQATWWRNWEFNQSKTASMAIDLCRAERPSDRRPASTSCIRTHRHIPSIKRAETRFSTWCPRKNRVSWCQGIGKWLFRRLWSLWIYFGKLNALLSLYCMCWRELWYVQRLYQKGFTLRLLGRGAFSGRVCAWRWRREAYQPLPLEKNCSGWT